MSNMDQNYRDIEDILDELGSGYIDEELNFIYPVSCQSGIITSTRSASSFVTTVSRENQLPVPAMAIDNNRIRSEEMSNKNEDKAKTEKNKLKDHAKSFTTKEEYKAKLEAKQRLRREKLKSWKASKMLDKTHVGAAFQLKSLVLPERHEKEGRQLQEQQQQKQV